MLPDISLVKLFCHVFACEFSGVLLEFLVNCHADNDPKSLVLSAKNLFFIPFSYMLMMLHKTDASHQSSFLASATSRSDQ